MDFEGHLSVSVIFILENLPDLINMFREHTLLNGPGAIIIERIIDSHGQPKSDFHWEPVTEISLLYGKTYEYELSCYTPKEPYIFIIVAQTQGNDVIGSLYKVESNDLDLILHRGSHIRKFYRTVQRLHPFWKIWNQI